MTKAELCNILDCSEPTLNRRLNSSKQLERDIFGVLLNFNKDELIARMYSGHTIQDLDLKLNLSKSTNIEENINNLFKNVEELNKTIQTTK